MRPELESLLAELPHMKADERAEVANALNAALFAAKTAELERLRNTASAAPVDKRVAKYVKLRDERAATNKAADQFDKEYKQTLVAIEASILKDAHEQGVTGFKTEAGTAYTEEVMVASIADDKIFFDFVRASGDLDFFERRLKVGHIKEYADANGGVIPPGLNTFRELKIKVRRA